MFEWITSPEAWIALVTLTALEIVLGIDNIIFLSILVSKLPDKQKQMGRVLGLGFALITRILLLLSLAWIIRLTKPLFTVFGMGISGRDLILILGGLFLMAKSVHEIHQSFEANEKETLTKKIQNVGFWYVIIQIGIMDIIFSLDSVITAVGLVDQIPVMVLAIVIAMIVMVLAAKSIGDFVEKHPTIKMLALSFLILIGVALLGEGFDMHIPKGYIYFAMFFSVCVEMLNLKLRK